MPSRRRHLPSLGAFATFEVAAKHASFTLAGGELHVTQAAISQQIRGLEKALGVALFVRRPGGLELTAEGTRLLSAVTRGLDAICDVVEGFDGPAERVPITCSGTNAVIALWLKPLVDRFRASRTDQRFVLLASDEDDTLRNFDEVDLSIVCGNERCEVGEVLHYLFPEIVEPVCSPEYLRRHGPFADAAALAEADLLELHRMHWSSQAIGWLPLAWSDWFEASGVATQPSPPTMVSNSYSLLVEAALAGEGIVLGWRHLVATHVAEGRLGVAFEAPLRIERGNYLKVNRASLDKPHVREFVDFVLAEVAGVESERPGRRQEGDESDQPRSRIASGAGSISGR